MTKEVCLPHDKYTFAPKSVEHDIIQYKNLNPLEADCVQHIHRGAVAQHSSVHRKRSVSSRCSAAVVAWSKVVEDLNPADLWILFIMSTDY